MVDTDDRLRLGPSIWTGILVAMLVGSGVCLATAPLLMPDSYSILKNAISESAAQGVEYAWVARLGFLLLGFAVLILANVAGSRWGVWGRLVFRLYGVAMIGNAVFSHMPWEDVPYDALEDLLHSVTAGATGMSFIAGVLIVMSRRGPGHTAPRVFDALAIVAALVISMLIFNMETIAGLIQRIMFGIAYFWFGFEALRSASSASDHAESPERLRPTSTQTL